MFRMAASSRVVLIKLLIILERFPSFGQRNRFKTESKSKQFVISGETCFWRNQVCRYSSGNGPYRDDGCHLFIKI